MSDSNDAVGSAATLDWLAVNDHQIAHQRLISQRVPGLGSWILETDEFQRWTELMTKTLLCSGKAGSGKSTYASLIVDTLREKATINDHVRVAFYYCRFQQLQKSWMILRSLLYQLCRGRTTLPSHIVDLYRKCTASNRHPWKAELLECISSILSEQTTVFFVVDALDELKGATRRALLDGLFPLQTGAQLQLLVTCDRQPEILERLSIFDPMTIPLTRLNRDVELLVEHQLPRLPEFAHQDDEARRVKAKIVKASNGLVLLAAKHIQLLAGKRSRKKFEKTLTSLPITVDRMWEQHVHRLNSLTAEKLAMAKGTLAWLAFAKRPLNTRELCHALCIMRPAPDDSASTPIEAEDVLIIGKDLVAHDLELGAITLTHKSLHTYLMAAENETLSTLYTKIASTCIQCLEEARLSNTFCQPGEELRTRLCQLPLYRYAAKYWDKHVEGLTSLLESELLSFLQDTEAVSLADRVRNLDDSDLTHLSEDAPVQMSGLHLAARIGQLALVTLLLDKGSDPTQIDSLGRSALWHATVLGHQDIIKLLNSVDRITFTEMLEKREKSLAMSMIRAAGEGLRDYRSRTAFHLGVVHADIEIMEAARQTGVDINRKDGDGLTPLQLAVGGGKVELINWLLQHSAAIDGITIKQWQQGYGQVHLHIVKVSMRSGGIYTISFPGEVNVVATPMDSEDDTRCLYVVMSMDDWPGKLCERSVRDQKYCQLDCRRMLIGDHTYHHEIRAKFPRPFDQFSCYTGDDLAHQNVTEVRIAWTMALTASSGIRGMWTSRDHMSTLPLATIPKNGSAMMLHFITSLAEAWNRSSTSVDLYLVQCRFGVLRGKGEDPDLIIRLLRDANTWITLRRSFHATLRDIYTFCTEYLEFDYEDDDWSHLVERAREMEREIDALIDRFDQNSSALIQLEFNLTSIREAQKSTTLNKSIKRLTWITFIFLPLTFVSSLFGMNVNALANNPAWWWYPVFAFAILGLTLTIWVIFKRNKNLEARFESWFAWLIEPSKAAEPGDVEAMKLKSL